MAKIVYLPNLAVLQAGALATLTLEEKLIISIRIAKAEKGKKK